jgi:hypothetical protein
MGALRGFERTVASVEEAKGSLVAAAPGGRRTGVPLAEALAGFEAHLGLAGAAMREWRIPAVEHQWRDCEGALAEAARRSEALRLGAVPEGYERLYGVLGDIIEPLEVFAAAGDRFRALVR